MSNEAGAARLHGCQSAPQCLGWCSGRCQCAGAFYLRRPPAGSFRPDRSLLPLDPQDERRADWFEGMVIKHLQDGFTQVAGQVPDQAALFGLLSQVRDLELWRL